MTRTILRWLSALCFVLALSFGMLAGYAACALNTQPPVLSPSAATALTNGLTALSRILQQQNVNPQILNAIADAQAAIAGDIAGHTWGQIVRDLLDRLYSQLPADILTKAWPIFAAIEVVLATIGA